MSFLSNIMSLWATTALKDYSEFSASITLTYAALYLYKHNPNVNEAYDI